MCGSRCKTRETFQVNLGKFSDLMSQTRLGCLRSELFVTQALRALSVAEHSLLEPSTGIRVKRDFKVFTGAL